VCVSNNIHVFCVIRGLSVQVIKTRVNNHGPRGLRACPPARLPELSLVDGQGAVARDGQGTHAERGFYSLESCKDVEIEEVTAVMRKGLG
jgi:hypothetical protein